MIEKVLKIVAEGGIHSYRDLADQLSITEAFLQAMLEDLTRLDYLRAVGTGCENKCASCPVGGCSIAGPGKLWSLTEKGSRAAEKMMAQRV